MKISIYTALSTNGFISNTRNVPDWLSNEYGQGLYAICQKFGAVIMGKTTYEILAPDHLPLKTEGATVVLTTDQTAKSVNSTVVFMQNSPAEIAKMLIDKGHTEAVIIGGAMTSSSFVNAGLVNDIYLVIEPVLFGTGLALLKGVEMDVELKLLEVIKLNDSTIQLHYELKNKLMMNL